MTLRILLEILELILCDSAATRCPENDQLVLDALGFRDFASYQKHAGKNTCTVAGVMPVASPKRKPNSGSSEKGNAERKNSLAMPDLF